MKVIGLTGKACAGKNMYAKDFSDLGFAVVDVDSLGHEALNQSIEELTILFGPSIVKQGRVDRPKLGSLVFSDSQKLRQLEKLTHPKMVQACQRLIDEAREEGKDAIVLNAALLARMQLEPLCDGVLFIYAPFWLRFLRCRKREGLSFKQFYLRNSAQKDVQPPVKKAVVVRNIFSKALIHRQVATYCDTMGLRISSG